MPPMLDPLLDLPIDQDSSAPYAGRGRGDSGQGPAKVEPVMKIQAAGRSDIGRRRENNEDAYLIDPALGLYVVCDGVGGHAAGEVASETACQVLAEQLGWRRAAFDAMAADPTADQRFTALEAVDQAIQATGLAVHEIGMADERRRGMSCTLTMMLVVGRQAIIGHVGDSRAYLLRGNQAHLLTDDHTMATDHFRRGLISAGEVARSPYTSALTRVLGATPSCEPDLLCIDLADGDQFVLCTDGLSDYLQPPELAALCASARPPAAARQMIDQANQRGGADNSTAIVLSVRTVRGESVVDVAQRIEAMRRIPLFKHLRYVDLLKVLNVVQSESWAADQYIIREGADGQSLYILLSGQVAVMKSEQTIAKLQPGSFFGEMALIDLAPRSADVIARSDCRTLSIPRDDFYRMLRSDPQLAVKLLWGLSRVLNQRLRDTSEQLGLARASPAMSGEVDDSHDPGEALFDVVTQIIASDGSDH